MKVTLPVPPSMSIPDVPTPFTLVEPKFTAPELLFSMIPAVVDPVTKTDGGVEVVLPRLNVAEEFPIRIPAPPAFWIATVSAVNVPPETLLISIPFPVAPVAIVPEVTRSNVTPLAPMVTPSS